MQSRKKPPLLIAWDRTSNNAQNTQQKLGVEFSYLERNKIPFLSKKLFLRRRTMLFSQTLSKRAYFLFHHVLSICCCSIKFIIKFTFFILLHFNLEGVQENGFVFHIQLSHDSKKLHSILKRTRLLCNFVYTSFFNWTTSLCLFLIMSTIAFLLLIFKVPFYHLQVQNGTNLIVCHRQFLKYLRRYRLKWLENLPCSVE